MKGTAESSISIWQQKKNTQFANLYQAKRSTINNIDFVLNVEK